MSRVAGWYRLDEATMRWWDGQRWTDNYFPPRPR